jgi:hypothetical protein
LADSANFVAEFKALAEKDTPLTNPKWDQTLDGLGFAGQCPSNGIRGWTPEREPSELFLAEFTEVATRAGTILGSPAGVNPRNYFLDCLYDCLSNDSEGACNVYARPGFPETLGRLYRVCEAAVLFWLRRNTKINAEKHGFVTPSEVGAFEVGPDVRVDWEPYYTGGILLFRNSGALPYRKWIEPDSSPASSSVYSAGWTLQSDRFNRDGRR